MRPVNTGGGADAGGRVVCAGCGAVVDPIQAPLVFSCPRRGPGDDDDMDDDIDHVLSYRAHPGPDVALPGSAGGAWFFDTGEANPFVRYRRSQYSWSLARRCGMSDDDYVALVRAIDNEVAAVDGRGFVVTPYLRNEALGVWLKDETGNVSGSHKARHLMGIAVYLAVIEELGLVSKKELGERRLAIASCGNAALAAAVIAKAVRRPLSVFIPPWADPNVVARLRSLGAELITCERTSASPPGDPCYHRFREAVAAGALPFTCQGNENGLTIDGGRTLGFELAAQHRESGAAPLDHVLIQVGGGALASAVIQALASAVALGAMTAMPRIHAVQTTGSHPLERAWKKLRERRAKNTEETAEQAAGGVSAEVLPGALDDARLHRSRYMWPWESEPKSIAGGIIDDETYDWLVIVRALIETGGSVIVAREPTLARARDAARAATGIDVSATGAAGLAGLLELGARAPNEDLAEVMPGQTIAVLFTGVSH